MKVVLLVALCCLLGMEVKVVSASNVFSDALNALTPSGCVVFSIASSNPISYDNLPAALIFNAGFRCDGIEQTCRFRGVVDVPKHIKQITITCDGSLGTTERSDVTL